MVASRVPSFAPSLPVGRQRLAFCTGGTTLCIIPARSCQTLRRRPSPAALKKNPATSSPKMALSDTPAVTPETVTLYTQYLSTVASFPSPPYLDAILHILQVIHGDTLMRPGDRSGLHPFIVPLARGGDGSVTGLLRWPTPPADFPMPVVRCRPGDLSVELLANSCKDYASREIAKADFGGRFEERDSIRKASSLAFAYQDGAVDESGLGLERYLLMNVAQYPDVYEGLASFHIAKGDEGSGLVACERHASVFPGWARAHVFHADVLMNLDRESEARDAARFGLQMPLWTAGPQEDLRRLAKIAGYEDEESLGKIYRRLYEDLRENEIAEGKPKEQVALDRAAYLLDLAVAEGVSDVWESDVCEGIAELYAEAGLAEVATFVRMM